MDNKDKYELKIVDSMDKDVLCDYYESLQEDNRLDVLMYEDNSLGHFIDFCYGQWIYICVLNGVDVGFTVFNSKLGRSRFFHFVMYNGGDKHAGKFVRMIFHCVFNQDKEDSVLTILGLTPKCYRHVFPDLRSLGMKEMHTIKQACKVKGKLRDAVFSCIEKETFYNKLEARNGIR